MQVLLLDNNQLHAHLGKKPFPDSLGTGDVVHRLYSVCGFTKDKTVFKSILDSCNVQGHNILILWELMCEKWR